MSDEAATQLFLRFARGEADIVRDLAHAALSAGAASSRFQSKISNVLSEYAALPVKARVMQHGAPPKRAKILPAYFHQVALSSPAEQERCLASFIEKRDAVAVRELITNVLFMGKASARFQVMVAELIAADDGLRLIFESTMTDGKKRRTERNNTAVQVAGRRGAKRERSAIASQNNIEDETVRKIVARERKELAEIERKLGDMVATKAKPQP